MANDNEPAKLLLPYLQRADELQKHEPLVAYYCRLYAMERGLKIPPKERTKTTNALLVSLMKQLEKDKKSLQLGPDDHLHLEGFALNVFSKADKQDRAGRADLNTAKTFYAASIFFEILNQFGELQPDLEQKQKYAAWKAADIRKAMKEGRKPVPGPPVGDNDLSVPSSMPSGEYDLKPSTTDPGIRLAPESDSSPQLYDKGNVQHTTNFSPASNIPPSPSDGPTSPSYPTDDHPIHNYHQPPPTIKSENPTYSQPYHHQPYQQEPQLHLPQHYPSHDVQSPHMPQQYSSHDVQTPHLPQQYSSHDVQSPHVPQQYSSHEVQSPHLPQQYPSRDVPSPQLPQQYPSHDVPSPHSPQQYSSHDVQLSSYPNFQSYPSFTESSLPAAPSHYPSYYQGSDAAYSTSSAPNIVNHQSSTQYSLGSSNGDVTEATPSAAQKYQYDSNYQPPPEKIAEAHKAARFAVGALAFDDVSVAVDFLKKSLELLTNPSAGQ